MSTSTSLQASQCQPCPECDTAVEAPAGAVVHEIVPCRDCGAELEILALEPTLQIALAPEVEEDWGE